MPLGARAGALRTHAARLVAEASGRAYRGVDGAAPTVVTDGAFFALALARQVGVGVAVAASRALRAGAISVISIKKVARSMSSAT